MVSIQHHRPITYNYWDLTTVSILQVFDKLRRSLNAVFAWLALLNKAPTADNLLKKNWPCNPSCTLCFCLPESCDHLLTECNFMEEVWDLVAQSFQVHPAIAPFHKGSIIDWILAISRTGSKKEQRRNVGIMFFCWWFVWKERNQCVFANKESSYLWVVDQIKSEVGLFFRVHSSG
jgi:hypothetical protein